METIRRKCSDSYKQASSERRGRSRRIREMHEVKDMLEAAEIYNATWHILDSIDETTSTKQPQQ
jgi:hypothetical protein